MDELPKQKKGRVRVADVDREMVWKLATIGCTLREISFITGLNTETITRNFGDLIEVGKATGKRALRKKQFEKAMEGSDRMLIWLGKQWLGQKDVIVDTEEDMPLPWNEEDD
jgi:hypothetical protein